MEQSTDFANIERVTGEDVWQYMAHCSPWVIMQEPSTNFTISFGLIQTRKLGRAVIFQIDLGYIHTSPV